MPVRFGAAERASKEVENIDKCAAPGPADHITARHHALPTLPFFQDHQRMAIVIVSRFAK
jgi:hypothetical protein